MKTILPAAMCVLASLMSCTRTDEAARPTIAVSIEPQRYFLEQLAGDRYDIVTILDNGANPEQFDPSVAKRVAADKAVAYLGIGGLPFETVISRSLNDPKKYFDTSAGIIPITGTHGHSHDGDDGDDDGGADPHTWTSVRNARTIAANMARALADIDPDHATEYYERLNAFTLRLDSIDRSIAMKLAVKPTNAFAVWHPSLSYYARDYGLEQIAVGQESKEVSLSRLKEVVDEAVADSVRVLFFQKEYDSRQAQNVNERIGSRMVTINPLAYEWEQQINYITNELSRP